MGKDVGKPTMHHPEVVVVAVHVNEVGAPTTRQSEWERREMRTTEALALPKQQSARGFPNILVDLA